MITNVSNIIPLRPTAPAASPTSSEPPSTRLAVLTQDTVEFSPLGRAMARAAAESTMRLAQIKAIRGEIQRGTYDTPERLRVTIDRLLKDIA